jgi:dolichol-phosphate mannosyltransferase
MIALIIPAYNEEKSIYKSLCYVLNNTEKFDEPYVLICVDDGSTDQTFAEMSKIRDPNFIALQLADNQGYGFALRYGVEHASKIGIVYAIMMDSDLTNPISEVPFMVEKLKKGYDLVKASRFLRNSDMSQVENTRKIFSYFGNVCLRRLFKSDIRDVTNGFRGWRIERYLLLPIQSRGFSSIVEEFLFASQRNFKVTELPSKLGVRNADQRSTAASYSLVAIFKYLMPGIFYFVYHRINFPIIPKALKKYEY